MMNLDNPFQKAWGAAQSKPSVVDLSKEVAVLKRRIEHLDRELHFLKRPQKPKFTVQEVQQLLSNGLLSPKEAKEILGLPVTFTEALDDVLKTDYEGKL